jgi:hypothetical protein
MDTVRHAADFGLKYKLYYSLLHPKMSQYEVPPCNSYNMNKKGFMIGVTTRSKQVFSQHQYETKEVTASLQDGNREKITVVAMICADGVMTQARQEIRIWRGLTQRHMEVRRRTVT